MPSIQLTTDSQGNGKFYLTEEGGALGEMEVSISAGTLTVYHTEVAEKAEGRGYAKLLLNELVAHARKNGLKVRPLCPYVHAQFKRQPEQYSDIWEGASAGV